MQEQGKESKCRALASRALDLLRACVLMQARACVHSRAFEEYTRLPSSHKRTQTDTSRAVVSARAHAHAGPGSGQRHDRRGQPAAGPERAGRILSDRGSDGGHRRHQCHGPRRGGGRHLPTGPSGAAQAPPLATSIPSLPSPFRPAAPSLLPSLPPPSPSLPSSLPPSLPPARPTPSLSPSWEKMRTRAALLTRGTAICSSGPPSVGGVGWEAGGI